MIRSASMSGPGFLIANRRVLRQLGNSLLDLSLPRFHDDAARIAQRLSSKRLALLLHAAGQVIQVSQEPINLIQFRAEIDCATEVKIGALQNDARERFEILLQTAARICRDRKYTADQPKPFLVRNRELLGRLKDSVYFFLHEVRYAVSYTHLTLPTICSV